MILSNVKRLKKIFIVPFKKLYAQLYPVAFARSLGVVMDGDVTIYGSSYYMFSSEPYLVSLSNNVFISVGVEFVCHDGSTLPFRKEYPKLELAGEIKVGENVFIGKGATILHGVTIGSNCIVGACSVVTKDVPDNTIVGGIPAKFIKSTDDFLVKANEESLGIGDLTGLDKVIAYKKIFNRK
ncbi:MAG: acyltransferase [Colwellia sp.]|jgi:Acetyltransferase (isoleucine patch superfamily)